LLLCLFGSQEKQQYTILLIITDGVINDFDNTKAAIIEVRDQLRVF